MHPAAWVQCFPWTDLLLESWKVGAASVELQGYFGNVSAHSRHLTKLLGRFYSTCNLSASVVPLTLSSCFSCHIYLSCRRFIWGRQHDIFGLLRAQESRAGSLSTFRSVVLCLQMICKCNRTQCKGHTLWRNHICLIVLEKKPALLRWPQGCDCNDPRMILGSSFPPVNHVNAVSVLLGSKKFQIYLQGGTLCHS